MRMGDRAVALSTFQNRHLQRLAGMEKGAGDEVGDLIETFRRVRQEVSQAQAIALRERRELQVCSELPGDPLGFPGVQLGGLGCEPEEKLAGRVRAEPYGTGEAIVKQQELDDLRRD